MGPWRRGRTPGTGGRPSGIELDPLVGLNDARKPLRSRLLAVPALRAQVPRPRTHDRQGLVGLEQAQARRRPISVVDRKEIEADTRKLTSFAAFQKSVADAEETKAEPARGRPSLGLKAFAEGRRKFLLNYPGIKNAAPSP